LIAGEEASISCHGATHPAENATVIARERSDEAIQTKLMRPFVWIASSLRSLAMTDERFES
jgi:hypothetical protein